MSSRGVNLKYIRNISICDQPTHNHCQFCKADAWWWAEKSLRSNHSLSLLFVCSEWGWWHSDIDSFWFTAIHSFAVRCSNAHEIGIAEVNDEGNEEEPNHECFLCWGNVSDNISSGVYYIVFVEVLEVADIPDGKAGEWNNKKDAAYIESSSGGCFVFGEESDVEAKSDNKWYHEEDTNNWVPPMDLLINEAIEEFNKHGYSKGAIDNSYHNKSTLDWEASAAW